MTKLFSAMFATMFVLALSTGVTRSTAAAAQPDAEIGACRYFCGADPTPFKTRAACDAVCSSECDAIC